MSTQFEFLEEVTKISVVGVDYTDFSEAFDEVLLMAV